MTKAIVSKTFRLPIGLDGMWHSRAPGDVTPPTVPVITASSATSVSTISITFSASTDDQSGVAEYVIKYRVNGAGSYLEHSRVPHSNVASITRVIDGLNAATSYQIVVSAVDASSHSNESDNSAPV